MHPYDDQLLFQVCNHALYGLVIYVHGSKHSIKLPLCHFRTT